MKAELEYTKNQLSKSQGMVQRLEGQLNLYDDESRTTAQRIKQLELELASAQKRYNEGQGTVSALREEIVHLRRNWFARQKQSDASPMTSIPPLQMWIWWQSRCRVCNNHSRHWRRRGMCLLRERDLMKRNLEKAEAQAKLTNLSPRKSLDLLESKLLKELGQTTRKITDLERQTNLSQSEKDTLHVHSRKLGMESALAISSLQKLVAKARESAELGPAEGMPENPSLTQVHAFK